jgi:hypothetical protein
MKNLVIDTSVYLTYAIYNKTYRLIDAFARYDLNIFINHQLMAEFERNLIGYLKDDSTNIQSILQTIKEATILVKTESAFNQSPDSKR